MTRTIQGLAALAGLIGMLVLGARVPAAVGAPGLMRCTGGPFELPDVQTTQFDKAGRRASVAWTSQGRVTLDCRAGSLTVDVWEHAAVTVAPNPNGTGAVLGGRVQLRVSVPDGGTIILGGIIQGTGSCAAGICTFNTIVQGSNRNEAKLQMLEGVRVDLGSEAVANVRVQRIVIDFTSAG